MKSTARITRLLIILAGLLFAAAARPAPSVPLWDGGGFPTATPTFTPVPTNTPEPTATNTPIFLEPAPENTTAPDFQLSTQVPPQVPETGTANPLIPVAYIALFIFLVVGIWMLFSRRGQNP